MTKAVGDEGYIGRRIRLRDLHVFFTVTQRGSMAKAAAELGITQPAVSRVIAQLEHALGARLLDRGSQGVEATMYGRALLKRGGVAFDELKQAIRDIEFLANPNVGEVRIGCPETIAVILTPVIEELSRRYPDVVPIVVGEVASPSTDFSELHARMVDLVVSRLFPPFDRSQYPDELNIQILFDDQVVIAAGTDSRWARRRKINLVDLADEPWILTEPNTWTRTIVAQAFGARGLTMPRVSLMTHSVLLRTDLLATGRFVAALPRSVLQLYARRFSLKALPVEIPGRPWPVAMVTLKNRTLSPVVELFIEHLRTFSQSLAGRSVS
jgi:DNA-binding transcriptional LysR family regulator